MSKVRVQAERETIQGIAEYLQHEKANKSISELWPEALTIFRIQFESCVLPPEGDE